MFLPNDQSGSKVDSGWHKANRPMGSHDIWNYRCWYLLLDLLERVRFLFLTLSLLLRSSTAKRERRKNKTDTDYHDRMHNECTEMSVSMTVTPNSVQASRHLLISVHKSHNIISLLGLVLANIISLLGPVLAFLLV